MSKTLADAISEKPKRLPRDARKFKILTSALEISKKEAKTPMYVFELESSGNPIENVGGEPVDPNGRKGKKWVPIADYNTKRLLILFTKAGISDAGSISIDQLIANPNPGMFVGKEILCICETKLAPQLKEDGVTPIIGSDGKQVVFDQFEIGDIV